MIWKMNLMNNFTINTNNCGLRKYRSSNRKINSGEFTKSQERNMSMKYFLNNFYYTGH